MEDVKKGDLFRTKTGRIRVENVEQEKITYTIFPDARGAQRKVITDTKETFDQRFPIRKK